MSGLCLPPWPLCHNASKDQVDDDDRVSAGQPAELNLLLRMDRMLLGTERSQDLSLLCMVYIDLYSSEQSLALSACLLPVSK